MIKKPEMVRELESRFLAGERMPYLRALRLFEALWTEAAHLGAIPRRDPMEGLEVQLRIARVLNSCSSGSSPA